MTGGATGMGVAGTRRFAPEGAAGRTDLLVRVSADDLRAMTGAAANPFTWTR
jgi:hypothetical protein